MATRAKRIPGVNRVGMMVRIAPQVREQIEAAAAASGRSLGQEVELRLSRSFDADLIQKAVADAFAEHEGNLAVARVRRSAALEELARLDSEEFAKMRRECGLGFMPPSFARANGN